MIGIITDSASDTPKEIIKKYSVEVVPLRVILGEKSYKDDIEIDEKVCLDYMKHNFAKTSLTAYEDVKVGFEKLINSGKKEIIAINVSSNISGTYNVFRLVAEELMKKDPSLKIEVINTYSISIGSGLLVCKATELLDEKLNFDEIITQLKKYVPQNLSVYYVIPTLKFLKAGGRIGYVSGTIGDILNLKPIIEVGNDGFYHTAGKARGIGKTVKKMMEIASNFWNGKTVEMVAVYYSGSSSDTLEWVETLKEFVMNFNVKKLYVGKIVPSMIAHVGPGLLGIASLSR